MDIRIYTTPTCGYCHQARAFLDDLGLAYKEYDVSRDRVAAEEMVKATGQMGVPVIIIDGEVVVGFDRERLRALVSSGNGRRPRFGLKIADASSVLRNRGLSPLPGAYIGGVSAGSPGEKAGLRSGDIITKINSEETSNADAAQRVLDGLGTGSVVSIIFRRGDDVRKSEIII